MRFIFFIWKVSIFHQIVSGYWLEWLKPEDGYVQLDVTQAGGRDGGKWNLKGLGCWI